MGRTRIPHLFTHYKIVSFYVDESVVILLSIVIKCNTARFNTRHIHLLNKTTDIIYLTLIVHDSSLSSNIRLDSDVFDSDVIGNTSAHSICSLLRRNNNCVIARGFFPLGAKRAA